MFQPCYKCGTSDELFDMCAGCRAHSREEMLRDRYEKDEADEDE